MSQPPGYIRVRLQLVDGHHSDQRGGDSCGSTQGSAPVGYFSKQAIVFPYNVRLHWLADREDSIQWRAAEAFTVPYPDEEVSQSVLTRYCKFRPRGNFCRTSPSAFGRGRPSDLPPPEDVGRNSYPCY